MTNGRYIDIENECLRNRLKEQRDIIARLCSTVRRYAEPRPGDPYCSRSELLNVTAAAEQAAQGRR